MSWLREKIFGMIKLPETKKKQTSALYTASVRLIEDVLFWRKMWLSLYFIFLFHLIFFVCVYRHVNLLQFMFCFTATIKIMDAFETWLKYKHRTSCLKRLASNDGPRLKVFAAKLNDWICRKYCDFLHLRESNHTKAFLLVNLILGLVYITGVYVNGYFLVYIVVVLLFGIKKWAPIIMRVAKKLQQNVDSDTELEGLIPEISDADIQLLTIEPVNSQQVDDRQSLDWKPGEMFPDDESCDSSENSSSFVSNLSTQNVQMSEENVETSDSSEDEYIPLVQQKEKLQSTLEIVQPSGTWGNTAYNTFWNITGALSNLVSSSSETKRERVCSVDSSDGFEIIDQNDLS